MVDTRGNETRVFEHIVCGIDGTPASLVAVRQATRLQHADGSLRLVAAANLAKAAQAGMAATHAAELLEDEAGAALADARVLAPSATAKLVSGNPVAVLLQEARSEATTLVVVGSHGRRRAAAMLLGTVAASMLRDAPCSVLVARPPRDPERWPQAVVVGVDGSTESAAAFSVGREIAERFQGSVRALASTSDQFDRDLAQAIAPELEEAPGRAVDVLAAASESADLVVVGSRGLHGLKALGSVSERVAHQAPSSVLVVRPTHPA